LEFGRVLGCAGSFDDAHMSACQCPIPQGPCLPFDIDAIILSFVDEVCLPLQRMSTRQYLAVLPSFLELSSTLPASFLEDGTVGAFQPSSFVLQGLSSRLTREVALQYVEAARRHHGKFEIEDDSKIFFNCHKTRYILAGNCAIDHLASTIEALKAFEVLPEFDLATRINQIIHGGREGGACEEEGEEGERGRGEGGQGRTGGGVGGGEGGERVGVEEGGEGGQGRTGGGVGGGEGGERVGVEDGGEGGQGRMGGGVGGGEGEGEEDKGVVEKRMTPHEAAQHMGPGESCNYDECCVFIDKMSYFHGVFLDFTTNCHTFLDIVVYFVTPCHKLYD